MPETRAAAILIAHDQCKGDLVGWASNNQSALSQFKLYATRSTGEAILRATDLEVELLMSGPLGGDSQAGALIAEEKVSALFFFWDPLSSHPHDVDVKALLRVAVLHNVAVACNPATADCVISSPLFFDDHHRQWSRASRRLS
jgi:methylglyoxal synthase